MAKKWQRQAPLSGITFAATGGMLKDSKFIHHWTLRHEDRRLICVERAVANGSMLLVMYDGLPIASCSTSLHRDVKAWAEQIRREWESVGWLTVAPKPLGTSAAH